MDIKVLQKSIENLAGAKERKEKNLLAKEVFKKLLDTDEGRNHLAKAMVAPIMASLCGRALSRNLLMWDDRVDVALEPRLWALKFCAINV